MRRRVFCNYYYIREKLSIRPRENHSLPHFYTNLVYLYGNADRIRAFHLLVTQTRSDNNREQVDVSRAIRWVENRWSEDDRCFNDTITW